MKKRNLAIILALLAFLFVLMFSRFFNLDRTARFIWDESSDLVNIHRIYVEKDITLIGPISENGDKVFGSLTYYLLLPFAALGNFDPVSTAYGAAFWGVVTSLTFTLLIYLVNKKYVFLGAIVSLLWFPLVQTGRWAWNPNFIPLWGFLSLIFYFKKRKSFLLSGLTSGLMFHHHPISIFAIAGFSMFAFLVALKRRQLKNFGMYLLGLGISLAPFVLFDLSHPPGLFLSRILYFNFLGDSFSVFGMASSLFASFDTAFSYVAPGLLKLPFVFALMFLVYVDLKKKSPSLKLLWVALFQIIGVSLFKERFSHYFLAAIPFIGLYLFWPRKDSGKSIAFIAILILIVSSFSFFVKELTVSDWQKDISLTRELTSIMQQAIEGGDLQNVNLAVLQSPDTNIYGRRYRDLLLLKDITLKTKDEYGTTDLLFVVSTGNADEVRKDQAYEISRFKDGPIIDTWDVGYWHLYLFARNDAS